MVEWLRQSRTSAAAPGCRPRWNGDHGAADRPGGPVPWPRRCRTGSPGATTGTSRIDVAEGMAKMTIARPEVRNAFRPQTLFELGDAFNGPVTTRRSGVVILTGEGPDAFCSGGDQKIRGDDGYIGDDAVAQQGIGRLNVLDLQIQIRRLPKPVVAMVAGYAIGGGHILHLVCDLTIAADNARFGQTGPEGGQLRRGLRSQPAGPHHRPEAGQGGLVPLPPVRRRHRLVLGPGQRGGAAWPSWRRRPWPGAARCCRCRPWPSAC